MQPNDLSLSFARAAVSERCSNTSDKRLLLAAVEKIRWNPMGNAGIDALSPVETDAQDITERTADDSNALPSIGGDISGRIAEGTAQSNNRKGERL